MLASTASKISFYKYKPKAVKLQGHIPFRKSCCKKCQNFENMINEAAKYLRGAPHDSGNVIDRTMCHFFQNSLVYYIPVIIVARPNIKVKIEANHQIQERDMDLKN